MKRVILRIAAVLPLALIACGSGGSSSGEPSSETGEDSPRTPPDGAWPTDTTTPTDAPIGDGAVDADGATPTQDGSVVVDGSTDVTDTSSPDDVTSAGDSSATPDTSSAPPSTCAETFTLPDESYTTVALETDFNAWVTPGVAMTKDATSGAWQVQVQVPYGKDVEYKFVTNGSNWIVNPSQPTVQLPSLTEGTNTNNFAPGITCGQPAAGSLTLVGGAVATTSSSYSFQVQYTPGAAGLDTSKTVVTLNGATLPAGAVTYDAATQRFSVAVASGVTAPNKFGYLFQVQDTNGSISRLFVPFWVEATSFEWTDSFMYEVMIDRFVASGTTSKAGPNGLPTVAAGDWKGGDFGGVTQKITEGYFDAMGVNTLWLSSPVLGTNLCEMGTGANTGYCLSGYHSYFPIASGWTYGSENDPTFSENGVTNPIDPHFGVAADLQALVNAAHQHGIRVLTDLVVNHVFADPSPPSSQTPQIGPLAVAHQTDLAWFNIPYSSSVNDCGSENLWDTSTSSTWNRADCWFDPYLPDLNTTNPAVNDAIAEHAVWLMEQFNLDGFRVDAVKQVTNNICLDLRSKITGAISTGLPFYMVGEALGSVEANVFDCVAPDKLNGSMDDTLHNTIVGTLLQGDTSSEGPAVDLDNGVVADEGDSWTGSVPTALMGHFFGSHDTPRAISLAEGDSNGDPWNNAPPAEETNPSAFSHLQLAQAFLLTYDSIPVVWMGDEFGQPGTIDPDCRRMMRFGTALSALETSTLTHFKQLGLVRAAHSGLRRGTRTRLWVDATFYAFGRVDPSNNDVVVAAFNLSDDPSAATPRTMNVGNIGLAVGTVLTDALSGTSVTVAAGGGYAQSITLTLPPLTAAVFTE